MTQVKIYPANDGDAFLIKDNKVEPVAILIDGGYASTFKEYIVSDLLDLAACRTFRPQNVKLAWS